MDLDIVYFRRRASEERTAAIQARNVGARQAHIAMAEEYERRVRMLFTANDPTSRGPRPPLLATSASSSPNINGLNFAGHDRQNGARA